MGSRNLDLTTNVVGTRFVHAILVATICIGCQNASPSITISVNRHELQERLDQRFPISRKTVLIDVTLRDPEVILSEGSDRIGVALDLAGSLPLLGAVGGNVGVSGLISYRQETKQFFFHELRIDALEIKGIHAGIVATVRNAVEAAAHLALAELPVYTLDQRTFREIAAERVLKSVRVRDGKLYLELGLP